MKIYVASSWRNEQQQSVVAALRQAGHEVYDFKNPREGDRGFAWGEIDPDWKAWKASDQIACYAHPAAVRGLKNDFDAMKWADAFVMVQPCGRSAALELGWAIGAGKFTLVLMVDGQEPELMIRLADHLCLSIGEVIEKLRQPPVRESCACDGAVDDGCYHCAPERWKCGTCGFPRVRAAGIVSCPRCKAAMVFSDEQWRAISFSGRLP